MTKFLLPIFIVVALVQWYVPGQVIWKQQHILNAGIAWRFEAEPVDPSDPFRGRYITLNFKARDFLLPKNEDFQRGEKIYVLLANDEKGFAKITGLSRKMPTGRVDFVQARVGWVGAGRDDDKTYVNIEYPFESLYMDEFKAPEAEKIYREVARDTAKKTWATVKILNGDPVLENVYIDNIPIGEMIK